MGLINSVLRQNDRIRLDKTDLVKENRDMVDEIQKAISEFEAKLKPITPEMMKAAGMPAVEVMPSEAPPIEKPTACLSKDFKKMVGVLPSDYIGKDGKDIKDLVVAFLDSLPECEE